MTDQTKKSILEKTDGILTEFLRLLQNGGGDFLTRAKNTQTLKPIVELLETHKGNIEPVLEHLQSAGNLLHGNVKDHPEIAAIGTALVLRHFKGDESRTRAFLNALCLRKIFRGEAGLLTKGFLALEGRDAGSAAANYAQDTVADVAASMTRFNEEDVKAIVKIVKRDYERGSVIYIDQNDWNLNHKEKEAVRENLAKMGYGDVQFVRQTQNVGTRVGGLTGMGIVYALAGNVSNSMKLTNNAPAPLAPAA